MARPLYMICSESGVIDRHSNTVSAFNIIESIQIFEVQNKDDLQSAGLREALPFLQLRVVATWISDEGDRDQEYHFETRLRLPGHDEWQVVHHGTFHWKTKNHRLISNIRGLNVEQGTLLIVNRIRRTGEEGNWLTQQYEIGVESSGVIATTD